MWQNMNLMLNAESNTYVLFYELLNSSEQHYTREFCGYPFLFSFQGKKIVVCGFNSRESTGRKQNSTAWKHPSASCNSLFEIILLWFHTKTETFLLVFSISEVQNKLLLLCTNEALLENLASGVNKAIEFFSC